MKPSVVISTVTGLLAVLLIMPITVYLWYVTLTAINASPLVWFLFWVWVPAAVVLQIAAKVIEAGTRE